VVMGEPADDDDVPSSLDDVEDVVPDVSSPDDDDVVSLDVPSVELVVLGLVLCVEATVVVWAPIEPEAPITPKAIANVARAVAKTRRRITRSRSARTRSFSAAISRGVGALGVMSTMVDTEPKGGLNTAWEVPECACSGTSQARPSRVPRARPTVRCMSALAFDPPSQDALAATALEALGEAVAIVDGGRILLATRAFHSRAGGNTLPAVVEQLIATGGGVDEAGPGGSLADVRACALPGGGEGWVVRLRDAAEALAALDPLTGLPNRRAFDARLEEEVARAHRTGRPVSLVLLDLDRFKHINDTHGHPAGDAVLAETARRLLSAARPGDVVARVGGEEFAWIVPEAGAEEGLAAADRARAALTAGPFPGGLHVTASAGVCEIAEATGPEALYQLADQALYWSKAQAAT
jgi:diguanylate cyclase (GGDEF)-like protein